MTWWNRMAYVVACAICGSVAHGASAVSKLDQVFIPEMLNADIGYFERITGPARNTYGASKTYVVSGCEVVAGISGGAVRSLRIAVSKSCTFNLNKFLPKLLGSNPINLRIMTFGQFDAASHESGRFYADCLSGCGNAADPVVYEHWSGSHADRFTDVVLEVIQVDGAALDAADVWRNVMRKAEKESWMEEAKFNCSPKYDAVAHQAFRNVRISAVSVGYGLAPPRCDR